VGTCARGLRENVLGNERTNMKWWGPSHVPHWQVDLAWLVTGKQAKLDAQETSITTPNERIARRPGGWWNETRSACTCCRTVGPGLPCRHAWPSAARAGVVWDGRLPKFSIEHCRLWLRGVTREPNCPLRRCRCCRYDITDHVSHKLLNRKAKCTCICLSSCLDYFVFYTHVYMAMHLICYSPN